jgi:hypothetical protein
MLANTAATSSTQQRERAVKSRNVGGTARTASDFDQSRHCDSSPVDQFFFLGVHHGGVREGRTALLTTSMTFCFFVNFLLFSAMA